MTIQFHEGLLVLSDTVGVEDAETILEWLQGTPHAQVDLSACIHMHSANVQVLAAAQSDVVAWPADAELTGWLQSILQR